MNRFLYTLTTILLLNITLTSLGNVTDNEPSKAPAKTEDMTCLVDLKTLSGEYRGDCKKGKANGQGVARGLDQYAGEFKKGLPNGKGVYVWLEGSVYVGEFKDGKMHGYGELRKVKVAKDRKIKLDIKEGYWVNGVYTGGKKEAVKKRAFSILKKQNARRVSVIKLGEGNAIEIEPESIQAPESLFITSTSGNTIINYMNYTRTQVTDVSYPVTLHIQYRPSSSATLNRSFVVTTEVEITEPGYWLIKITP